MARINQVTPPPLKSPIADANGKITNAWAIWCRDLYARTSDKKSNSIDENKASSDQALLSVDTSLEEAIDQVNVNTGNILTGALHQDSEAAHGSNGNIVGFDDLATEVIQGLVKQMAAVAAAVNSTVEITETAVDAPLLYIQSSVQETTDLARANKAGINQLTTDLNAVKSALNLLLANSKAAGQMANDPASE